MICRTPLKPLADLLLSATCRASCWAPAVAGGAAAVWTHATVDAKVRMRFAATDPIQRPSTHIRQSPRSLARQTLRHACSLSLSLSLALSLSLSLSLSLTLLLSLPLSLSLSCSLSLSASQSCWRARERALYQITVPTCWRQLRQRVPCTHVYRAHMCTVHTYVSCTHAGDS